MSSKLHENTTTSPSLNNDMMSTFFYDSADLFCIVSIDGNFIELNPAWKNSLGYSSNDLVGKSFIQFVHPDDKETSIFEFKKQLEGDEIVNFINRYRDADGNYVWFDWKGKINKTDNRIYAIARDISAQKKLEEELYLGELKYRILTESTDDLIMRFDRNYKHLFVNSAAEKLFGIKKEDFIGKDHQELGFVEADYTYWDSKIEDVFITGKPSREVVAIENGKLYNDWSLIPELNNEGKVVSVLSYSRDITNIMKAQQKLEESEVKLKSLNEEKDKFFSIISHDLRNPFIGFMGMTDVLLNDLSSLEKEDLQFIASNMNKSAKHLFELLENLLDWSCMQSGIYQFQPTSFNLNEQIENVIDTMEETFKTKEITIIKNFKANSVILADKNMINAIFRNLISNAFKFTPRGGSIGINIAVNVENNVEIEIKDTGIGMPQHMVDNLFSLSRKINRNGTESEKSSGLGLILVKEYLDKNNGTVTVNSIENQGTSFLISFPITPTV
ncbi:MAG: PAS domain-containing sensor histidine kinase [Bacteroidota bacterium]